MQLRREFKNFFKQRFFWPAVIAAMFLGYSLYGVVVTKLRVRNYLPVQAVFQYYDVEDGPRGKEKRVVFSYVNPSGQTKVYRSVDLVLRRSASRGGGSFTVYDHFKVGDTETLYYKDDDHVFPKSDSLFIPTLTLFLGIIFAFGSIKNYRQDKKR